MANRCLICASKDVVKIKDGTEFREPVFTNCDLYRCRACKFEFRYPMPTPSQLNDFYKGYINRPVFKGEIVGREKKAKYLLKYLPSPKCEQIFLEVGCGNGSNVRYLRSQGYTVIGLDIDAPDGMISADIMTYDSADKYDVVYSLHTLEHQADPVAFMRKLWSFVKNGGMLLIEIPWLADPLLRLKAFQRWYLVPEHLGFYQPSNLIQIAILLENQVWGEIHYIQKYNFLNFIYWQLFRKPHNPFPDLPVIDKIYRYYRENGKKTDTGILWLTKSYYHD